MHHIIAAKQRIIKNISDRRKRRRRRNKKI